MIPVIDQGFCLLLSIPLSRKGNVQEIHATKLKQLFTDLPKMRQNAISVVKKRNMQKTTFDLAPVISAIMT